MYTVYSIHVSIPNSQYRLLETIENFVSILMKRLDIRVSRKLTQKLDILPSSQPRHEGWRSQCEWYLLKLDQSLQHSWSESSPHRLAWRPEPFLSFLVKPNPCPYDILEKNGGCFVRLLILIPISYAYTTGFSCFIPAKKKNIKWTDHCETWIVQKIEDGWWLPWHLEITNALW